MMLEYTNGPILLKYISGLGVLGSKVQDIVATLTKAKTGQIHRSTGVPLDTARSDVELGPLQLRARIRGSGSRTSRWLVAP
jgi:hypothetical protein